MRTIAVAAIAALVATGCASNPVGGLNSAMAAKSETTEAYYIVDMKTNLDSAPVYDALERGAGRNTNGMEISKPLMMGAKPASPGRFELVNPLETMGMGGLAGLAGSQATQRMKTAKCDGAGFIGKAVRDTSTHDMNMFVCAYPYEDGYSLQVYTNSTAKRSGGFKGMIEKGVMGAIGSEEEWTRNTVQGMLNQVAELGSATMTLEESSGPLDIFDAEGNYVVASET